MLVRPVMTKPVQAKDPSQQNRIPSYKLQEEIHTVCLPPGYEKDISLSKVGTMPVIRLKHGTEGRGDKPLLQDEPDGARLWAWFDCHTQIKSFTLLHRKENYLKTTGTRSSKFRDVNRPNIVPDVEHPAYRSYYSDDCMNTQLHSRRWNPGRVLYDADECFLDVINRWHTNRKFEVYDKKGEIANKNSCYTLDVHTNGPIKGDHKYYTSKFLSNAMEEDHDNIIIEDHSDYLADYQVDSSTSLTVEEELKVECKRRLEDHHHSDVDDMFHSSNDDTYSTATFYPEIQRQRVLKAKKYQVYKQYQCYKRHRESFNAFTSYFKKLNNPTTPYSRCETTRYWKQIYEHNSELRSMVYQEAIMSEYRNQFDDERYDERLLTMKHYPSTKCEWAFDLIKQTSSKKYPIDPTRRRDASFYPQRRESLKSYRDTRLCFISLHAYFYNLKTHSRIDLRRSIVSMYVYFSRLKAYTGPPSVNTKVKKAVHGWVKKANQLVGVKEKEVPIDLSLYGTPIKSDVVKHLNGCEKSIALQEARYERQMEVRYSPILSGVQSGIKEVEIGKQQKPRSIGPPLKSSSDIDNLELFKKREEGLNLTGTYGEDEERFDPKKQNYIEPHRDVEIITFDKEGIFEANQALIKELVPDQDLYNKITDQIRSNTCPACGKH